MAEADRIDSRGDGTVAASSASASSCGPCGPRHDAPHTWRNDSSLEQSQPPSGVEEKKRKAGGSKPATGVVKEQINALMERGVKENKYPLMKRLTEMVKRGQLVWKPGHKFRASLDYSRDCWKVFCQLDVYMWLPHVLLGDDWLPDCPGCSRRDKVTIMKGEPIFPRMIYSIPSNYLLWSPARFNCDRCRNKRAEEARLGMPKKEPSSR